MAKTAVIVVIGNEILRMKFEILPGHTITFLPQVALDPRTMI
jgi:hypothetical protein